MPENWLVVDPLGFIRDYPLLFLFMIALIISWWRAFKKIGYPGVLSLIFLIHWFLALVAFIWLGFHKWPIEKELETLRRKDTSQANKEGQNV